MSQNPQQEKFGLRENTNLAYAIAKIHAFSFYPFIRRDFGTDAFGFPAFCAMILMLLYGGLARVPEMFPYLALWLGMVLAQRLRTATLVRRGFRWHSRYEGYPIVAFFVPFIRKESTAKGLIEPLILLAVGAFLHQVSPPFGAFVLAGCVSLALVEGMHREINRRRLVAMRDAEIEQRYLTARYRGEVDD
jgi:hypothetical protein